MDRAYCFGSSLHLVALRRDARIAVYDVQDSHSVLRVVVAGSVGVFIGGVELKEEGRADRGRGWMEMMFSVPSNTFGVLDFSVADGEAFVGFLSFSAAVGETHCSPCAVTRSFCRRGWWRHLVSWKDLSVEKSHSLLRIYRGSVLVAQLLPLATGSFCDECEEDNPQFIIKLLK